LSATNAQNHQFNSQIIEESFQKNSNAENSSSCFALFGLNDNEDAVIPSRRKSS
jgi:hypothetical protein